MKLTTYKRIALYYYWLIIVSAIACLIGLASCTYRINRNCQISVDQNNQNTSACIICDSLLGNLLIKKFRPTK